MPLIYAIEANQGDRPGVRAAIGERLEREIIERLHEIGLTGRTSENTKFIFTSVEELDRDYIRFYK